MLPSRYLESNPMPKISMTARWVQSVEPPEKGQVDYFDQKPGGVILRVTEKGVKSWCVMYRHTRRLRRLTLGKYPTLSLADARELAGQAHRAVALGEDPAMQKQARRTALTVSDLAAQYIERYAKVNKRSWRDDEQMLNRDIIPNWGKRLAADITRQDVMMLLDEIVVKRNAPIMANRVRALLSKMFNWAISRYMLEHNPCTHVTRPGKERQRDRVLSEDEIFRIWRAWETLTPVLKAYFQILLLTAQRATETLSMRWDAIAIDTGWWTIPGDVTKNKLAHRVPLSDPVIQRFLALRESKTPYVFPSAQKRGRHASYQSVYAYFRQIQDGIGIVCTPHDLRRTAASFMAGMGVNRLTVGKVLNHAEPGVTAVYDRHSYDTEKRQALDAWARKLMAIVGEGEPAKVIPLRRSE